MIKRIMAMIVIVILAGLYLTAFVSALLGFEGYMTVLTAALAATVILPVTIHLFLMINNARKGKSVMDEPYAYKEPATVRSREGASYGSGSGRTEPDKKQDYTEEKREDSKNGDQHSRI